MHAKLRRMDSTQTDRMIKIFNLAYYTVKSEMSFPSFPGLHKQNGVDLGDSDNTVARSVSFTLTLQLIVSIELPNVS